MVAKKHVFKVTADKQRTFNVIDGSKFYHMKLVGENGEEVVINQPYRASYNLQCTGPNLVYIGRNDSCFFESYVIVNNQVVKYKIRDDHVVMNLILDENNEYQLELKSKGQGDGVILPRASWKFVVQDEMIPSGEFHIDRYKKMQVFDNNGTQVIGLLNIGTYYHRVEDENGRFKRLDKYSFFFESSDPDNEDNGRYITVLEGYKNIYNKPFLIYFSDKNGCPFDTNPTKEKSIEETISNFRANDILENILLTSSNLLDIISQENTLELFTHPTDSQFQTIVEHLTEDQLKILAQDLNKTKLKEALLNNLKEDKLEDFISTISDDKLVNFLDQLDTSRFKAITDKLPNNKVDIICNDTLKELEQCKAEKAEMSDDVNFGRDLVKVLEILMSLAEEITKVHHELEECNRCVGGNVWE